MAKGIPFPAGLSPNERAYSPGEFPISEFQGLNGAVTAVQYGNRVADSALELTFTNVSDDKAFAIFEHYQLVNGGRGDNGERYWAELSREVSIGPLAGIANESLRSVMAESRGNRRYRYAEPPTITSVFPGVSTVSVKFRGYIDGAKST